ncbi:uncharacterized protein LOC110430881 [Sorghum bicolor]|uniref:uncharacterized protein LOC110430881 n=1 Tax=Sorghum bicolor TaxID=4558 RepID=UPI000B426D5A|nr:uncharacterized protein LOC110430881 [Sorghum bicolor]|eukprot:XP_021304735.1 uncharacterized protein LOC110430881 [Sorghum bicolor]
MGMAGTQLLAYRLFLCTRLDAGELARLPQVRSPTCYRVKLRVPATPPCAFAALAPSQPSPTSLKALAEPFFPNSGRSIAARGQSSSNFPRSCQVAQQTRSELLNLFVALVLSLLHHGGRPIAAPPYRCFRCRCPRGQATSSHCGTSYGHQQVRTSPGKLPRCYNAADEHSNAETTISGEVPCFQFATRDFERQFDVLQGSNCTDCDSDYAPEESDPQWVASEFVDPSGFSELPDFPSHQGKPDKFKDQPNTGPPIENRPVGRCQIPIRGKRTRTGRNVPVTWQSGTRIEMSTYGSSHAPASSGAYAWTGRAAPLARCAHTWRGAAPGSATL